MNTFQKIPSAQAGIPSGAVRCFIRSLEEKAVDLHSFLIIRDGKLAVEAYYSPFAADTIQPIYSVTKSFTAAAVGFAIADGFFYMDDCIADYFPEKADRPLHPFTKRMTIRHMLEMRTVHKSSVNVSQDDDWIHCFLTTQPTHPSGTTFAYDTINVHTLCGLIQKVTGKTVEAYLREKLFDKIGIGEVTWAKCAMGINKGGSGIASTPMDLARFGQFFLQKGSWEGEQLLPASWVEEAVSCRVQTPNGRFILDGNHGYGYLFWRVRHDCYCAFGMGGQLIVVDPRHDLVFVTTANTLTYRDGQQLILDSFWETIYPELQDHPVEEPPEQGKSLERLLNQLQAYLPKGKGTSPLAEKIDGKKFDLNPNERGFSSVSFSFDQSGGRMIWYGKDGEKKIPFDFLRYREVTDPFTGYPAAASGVWVDDDMLFIKIHLFCHETESISITCSFTPDAIGIDMKSAGPLGLEHTLDGNFGALISFA